MVENMNLIEGAFLSLLNDKESLHEIIFSWMCLMNGAISIMMRFPNLPNSTGKKPRELFSSMMDRFVSAI
jgi:hypothetical protein